MRMTDIHLTQQSTRGAVEVSFGAVVALDGSDRFNWIDSGHRGRTPTRPSGL